MEMDDQWAQALHWVGNGVCRTGIHVYMCILGGGVEPKWYPDGLFKSKIRNEIFEQSVTVTIILLWFPSLKSWVIPRHFDSTCGICSISLLGLKGVYQCWELKSVNSNVRSGGIRNINWSSQTVGLLADLTRSGCIYCIFKISVLYIYCMEILLI